jgi:hypothetical protein
MVPMSWYWDRRSPKSISGVGVGVDVFGVAQGEARVET